MVGIGLGKNSFYIVGLDQRGAILLRRKWSRGKLDAPFANMLPCLIGMEACVGAHHLSRKLQAQIRARNSSGRWDVINNKEPTHVIETVSARRNRAAGVLYTNDRLASYSGRKSIAW